MRIILGAVLWLAFAGAGAAQSKLDGQALQAIIVPPLPENASPRPVALTRVKSPLRDDQGVGTYWWGAICIEAHPVSWKDVQSGFSNLKDIFGEELKAAGFKPNIDPGSMFAEAQGTSTDLEVGALLKGVEVSYCENLLNTSGRVRLDVEWQVYSNLRREIVANIQTHEGVQVKSLERKAKRSLDQMAFAANVRALLSDVAFRDVVLAADPQAQTGASAAASQQLITLNNATKGPTKISDAVGAVVAVFAGDAFGSGVLVSADGLVLTNHHVVGGMKTVRIRWSDGFEATGEVLRSDKRRDVALLKLQPRGRQPLAVSRTLPTAGSTAFAIGTPLDPTLQNTVTRGVVSANRIVNGFSFIQADVPVTHGNSGGPLLDERGAVIGLTDWGVPAEEGSTLNFFIPIGDALDFLALKSEVETALPAASTASPAPRAATPARPKRR